MKSLRWMIRCGVGVLALAMLTGCAGYQLGTMLPPNLRSVHVPPFANQSGEPDLENELTGATIREFQQDGTLRVLGAEQADLVLEATITDYRLEPLRFERDDRRTTTEYRMRVTVDIVFRKTANGEVFVQRTLVGEGSFPTGGDLIGAKQVTLPAAAKNLAHKIVETVVEHW